MDAVIACYLPHLAAPLVMLGLFAIVAANRGFGKCWRCEGYRTPRCECPGGKPDDPQVKRPRWKL